MLLVAIVGMTYASPWHLASWLEGNSNMASISVSILAIIALVPSITRGHGIAFPWAVFPFLAWNIISAKSSESEHDTLYFVLVLAVVTLTAMLIVFAFSLSEVLWALIVMALISFALSLILLALEPGTVMTSIGLAGVFGQKNILGFVLAIGYLATLCVPKVRRPTRTTLCVIMLAGILLAESTTALMTCVVTTVTFSLVTLLRRYKNEAGATILIVVASAALALPALWLTTQDTDGLLALVGKSPTLSDRSNIWTFALWLWHQRSLTGWGLNAVWGDDTLGPAIRQILANPSATHAHSGYIDLLLQTGIWGAACFALFGIVLSVLALRAARLAQSRAAMFPLTLVVFMATYDLVEQRFFNPLGWFVLVIALCTAQRLRSINATDSNMGLGSGAGAGDSSG